MQVFITVAEVTDGGPTGRACDDNNPHSLQLRWNLLSRHTSGGRVFCYSDLQAVMHVSLAYLDMPRLLKGHNNYMQHIQLIWQPSTMGQLTEVEFAEWTYRRRVAHSVTVTYRPLCMFLWLF